MASSFKYNLIIVPLLMSTESSSSTVKIFDADDVHLCCLSSLCLEMTSTFEATKNDE